MINPGVMQVRWFNAHSPLAELTVHLGPDDCYKALASKGLIHKIDHYPSLRSRAIPTEERKCMTIRVCDPFSSFSVWMALFLMVLPGMCASRDKKDVVIFANGDRMTCEIMQLQKGYLYVRLANGEGTIPVDWTKVVRIESKYNFVVSDESGERFTSGLKSAATAESADKFAIVVTRRSATKVVPGREIVAIEQNDINFWQNIHGSIDSGLNFTKQQNRLQFNFGSTAIYAKPVWSANADLSSSFSGGGAAENFRYDLQLQGIRQMRSPRNAYMGIAGFQHNGEQELDLRTTLGGALAHNFKMTNNSLVMAYGGADWNSERYSQQATTGQTGNSAEAIVGSQFNFFRFRTTNFLLNSQVYPSLTDLGRVRLDLNASLKLRIAKRLYWNFSYYLNYDSHPPQNLPQSDYGSAASIGWKF